MSSITIYILFISALFANSVNVSAEPHCPTNCECASISSQIEYTCKDNENNTLSLYCSGLKEVKISCEDDTISKEWYKLLEGVDLSANYDVMTIQRCPIPEKSIKDILAQLSIGKINTLTIDYSRDPQNSFRADHFRGLDFVTNFYFRSNNVASFSDDALVGLSNLTRIFLNGNNLQRISPNFFHAVKKLTFVDLAGNNLTQLDKDTFESLSILRTLNLNGNKLTNISAEVFKPLRSLLSLDLSNNGITTFNADVFRHLPKVEVLNLSFNNVTVLPEEILRDLKSLNKFRAIQTFSPLTTTIPSKLFSSSKMLQEIVIERNKLTYLPDTIFKGLTNLRTLSLHLNRLTDLPSTLFQTTANLRKLDLSFNRLTSLNETVFRGLDKLEELNLDHNELSFIHENAFNELLQLRQLHLSTNRLGRLQANVFHHLEKLQDIHLDNNKLDMSKGDGTSNSVLDNCLELREVHLRNNSVDRIFSDWSLLPVHLHILDLAHNKLESLEPNDLNFLQAHTKTVNVNLEDNNITTFYFEKFEPLVKNLICPNDSCANKKYDLKISLRNNPINCDCKNYDFIRMIQGKMSLPASDFVSVRNKDTLKCDQPKHMSNVKLIEVDLANLYCSTECPGSCTCQLRAIDRVTVVNCTNVDQLPTWLPNNTHFELILAHNELKNLRRISPLMTPNVTKYITKLSLSWNSLENIDDLNVPHSLKVLELDHNRISVLKKSAVEMLNQTRASISLHGNPWKCDCNAKYLVNFIKSRFSEALIPNGSLITCEETSQAIIQLSEDGLCSKAVYLYIICLTLAVFGILFGALTILYLQYEHEIKVFMFAHKICLWLVTEKEVDRDKEFDAFISYAHQDEEFVVKDLIPHLENGPHAYKLCLHYRNWVVGDLIPEQIVRSVGSSRRTIIVLSRNYLESKWANLEFRTAYLQALKERHARLIVILLEDLDPSIELDSELKAYITMNTYLKWGDSLFWDKLRYALPHPQHYRNLKATKRKTIVLDRDHRRKLIEEFSQRNIESAKIATDVTVC